MLSNKLSNNHNCHWSNFLGSLVVAQQKKKVTCSYWPCSKLILATAKILRAEGFITNFSIAEERNTYRITVYLKYYNTSLTPIISFIEIYASPSRAYNRSYKQLEKLVRGRSAIFFLSTIHGLKTSEYCLSNKIGGNILFKLR